MQERSQVSLLWSVCPWCRVNPVFIMESSRSHYQAVATLTQPFVDLLLGAWNFFASMFGLFLLIGYFMVHLNSFIMESSRSMGRYQVVVTLTQSFIELLRGAWNFFAHMFGLSLLIWYFIVHLNSFIMESSRSLCYYQATLTQPFVYILLGAFKIVVLALCLHQLYSL